MKKFFTILILLSACCLLGGCTDLSEETQAQLDKDTEHAAKDAKKYLEGKYHTEYELNTFEPYIYFITSEANWFNKTHYNSTWTGKFTIDGRRGEIQARVSENIFGDNYQAEQIRSAYKELAMQYFPHVYEENGIIHEVTYEIKFRRNPNTGYRAGFFSAYYDGNNLEELLQENGMGIHINIDIDEDIEISDEFWLECEKAVANLEKDFEGAEFYIERLNAAPFSYTAYGEWKSARELEEWKKSRESKDLKKD